MTRGQHRVYLGSAPGVGKTYRMLDEGWRRRSRGTDVVIGYVETHGRVNTDALIRDLEVVPRKTLEYRGARLEEMDLAAVLERRPGVALVDELAHTNVPGSQNEKRWRDVEQLLEAGIDVISTVNIQHLESVNDVVEKITGITQQETVPDVVVRRAEQIELVDVTPEALRRRMAHGNIYAADKIDASLSNYFRVGNLSALRELALLWLADRVEDALRQYQVDHAIDATWETRERLIVGVSGAQVDEVLLRRAARIASRTGAQIVAVHVVSADATRRTDADTTLARDLTAEFEGTFHEIVDDDVATALVAFARSERGTQIVVGASRPRSATRPLGGVVERVLRRTPDLDVHVIAAGDERPAHVHRRRSKRAISIRRQLLGLALTAVSMPLVTIILTATRSGLSLSSEFLFYLLVVLGLTTVGGALVGVAAALVAFVLENYYFVHPLHTFSVSRPNDVVSLVGFLVFAAGASLVVNRLARGARVAERSRAEARVLSEAVANLGTTHQDLLPLLDSLRAVFDAEAVAILARDGDGWRADVASGVEYRGDEPATRFTIDDGYELALLGATLDNEDRQLVSAFTGRIAAGLRAVATLEDASELRAVAQVEAKRTGLVRALANEFREPLATIRLYATTQLEGDGGNAQRDRLVDVDHELERLTRLVNDVDDFVRLESGRVTPEFVESRMRDIVAESIARNDLGRRDLDVDVSDDLPTIATDPDLARRAVGVIVRNACRFSPPSVPVRITAGVAGESLELLVIDRGLGVPEARRTTMLEPIWRSDEGEIGTNLGLSVANGLLGLLGATVRYEDTPGGGLTAVLEFPLGPNR